jgi:hypothetical protein
MGYLDSNALEIENKEMISIPAAFNNFLSYVGQHCSENNLERRQPCALPVEVFSTKPTLFPPRRRPWPTLFATANWDPSWKAEMPSLNDMLAQAPFTVAILTEPKLPA